MKTSPPKKRPRSVPYPKPIFVPPRDDDKGKQRYNENSRTKSVNLHGYEIINDRSGSAIISEKVTKNGLKVKEPKKTSFVKGRGISQVSPEFFQAVYKGKVHEVRNIITEDGNNVINTKNPNDDTTPLHHAASGGNVDIIKILLDNGGKIDAKDNEGLTPLHYAAIRGKRAAAYILLDKGAPFDDSNGVSTVLEEAIIRGDPTLVSTLLKNGAKFRVRSSDQNTAIHLAASLGYRRTLGVLLSVPEFKEHIDDKTKNGTTPLHMAIHKNRPTCVQILLANGANVNKLNGNGKTCLHMVVYRGYTTILRIILKEYINKVKLDKKDRDGRTALHIAVRRNYVEIIYLLLEAKSNVSIPDSHNSYPIHIACKMGYFQAVKALLKCGANASVLDSRGETPLDKAAIKGYSDVCNYLSETGGVDISVLYSPKNHIIQPPNKEVTGPIDDYGWYIEHRVSQKLQCSQNPPENIKSKNIRKCEKILNKWEAGKNHKKRVKKLKRKIIKGQFPKFLRGQFWKLVLRVDNLKKELNLNYQKLLEVCIATKDAKQIDKDVARTMRTHRSFSIRYGKGQMKLFRILRAYAAYDIEIGYVQSMSTIASMLLLFIENEEDCFYALVSLFKTHGLRFMLIRDLEGLRETAFTVYQKLIAFYFPEVGSHFEFIGIHPSLFLTNWLLELFFGYIPFTLLLQLWDLFVLDGYSVLYSFILAIFSFNQEDLLRLKDTESFNEIKHMPVSDVEHDKLLYATMKSYKLTSEQIHDITGLYPHSIV